MGRFFALRPAAVLAVISVVLLFFFLHALDRLLPAAAFAELPSYANRLLDRLRFGLLYAGLGNVLLFLLFSAAIPEGQAQRPPLLKRGKHTILAGLLGFVPLFFVFALSRLGQPEQAPAEGPDLDGGAFTFPFLVLLVSSGLLTAILEEWFYRGGLQYFMECKGVHPVGALLVANALFALAHNPGARAALFIVGLCFAVLFWRYGLVSTILAHTVYNTSILILASLNSGHL